MKVRYSQTILRVLMVLLALPMAWVSAWGSYNTWLRASTDDTAKGLVYASSNKSQTPADNVYGELVLSDNKSGSNGANQSFYGWAKPARGYAFATWTGYTYSGTGTKSGEGSATFPSPKQTTGVGDLIYSKSWSGGAGSDQANSVKASWNAATSYNVVYKEPVGGSYTVDYSYKTINSSKQFVTSTEKLELAPGSGDKRPYGISDGSQEGFSYAADVVTLSTDAGNFVGWYEDGLEKSTANPYTYPVTKTANVTALFKWIEPVAPEEKHIRTTNNSADVNESVVFSMENIVANWATADFTVTLVGADGSGTFALGTVSYNATDKELTVPFTYNANGTWDDGSSVTIQVAPINSSYGTTASVLVKAIAQENSANQARVSGDGFATQEGDLTDMLAIANANTDATVTLLQSVAVSSPLVVTKSMTLDLNNWVLSSTTANKIISVEGTDTKLIIADNSFLKGSEIQLTRSANAAITAIEVTGANRLLYNHGKMTVTNNAEYASNSSAKAYGIYVSGTGNVVLQGGSIAIESDHYARGVVIATGGNATLNVCKIEATANVNAIGIYSSGKINVAEGMSTTASTQTGETAYALYIKAGTAVVDNVIMNAASATNKACGVYVKAGKLTLNGGSITATAATPNVYGVYVTAGASVTIQQQANIIAELTTAATGSADAQAFGIQNLGTLKLINSTVTATSLNNYATAVNSMSSATSTTIEGGTYTAQSATGYAYGLHHQYGALNVDGGAFSGIAAGGTNAYGARATVSGTIANATLIAEAAGSGKKAYGFVAATAGTNITLTNCTIKAKSATTVACAISSKANTTATGCTLEAKTLSGTEAYGFSAPNGTNNLVNTDAVVESFTTIAYGIKFTSGTLTVDGGTYRVTAKQATAGSAADSEIYGVWVADGKTANLSNASFTVAATNGSFSQKAYGTYTGTGTINSTGCTYSVSASKQAYGVFGNASSSTLNLQNNTINASTIGSTSALGIYSAGHFTVNGDDVTSNTKSYASYSLYFTATAQGEVLGGKFMAKGISTKSSEILAPINTDASAANVHVKGGFYSDNVRLRYYVPTGYDIYGVDPNAPEYAEKYYYTVNDHLPYENVCYITEQNVGFPTLEEAFDYARNHSGANYNIIMTQPYTLPAGNYSLPANAKLVVPDRVSRTTAIGTTAERQFPEQDLITENRCLTFANGVNLDVYGMIEVSAKQYTVNVGRIAYVLGPYGRIHLNEGSTVTLNNGAKINAWGYITGQGEIRVKNGAEVREFFQVHDMKAASAITDWTGSANKNTYKAFLMNQYYIQNVEAPTKYYYGGKLIGSLSITSNATAYTSVDADNVQLVAPSKAFFTVDTDDESAWVRKSYNPTTDRILWETNSSASLGSIKVEMSSYGFDSKDYTLPFTNNMTIHALSGIFNITQSTVLLPGCEIEVDKTATLHINEKDVNGDDMGLYLYDLAQWGKFYDSNSKYFMPAMYSPSWTNGVCPRGTGASNTCLKDAAIYVKGKIEVVGSIYTTAGGAAIYSDGANAGTIEFSADAAADGTLYTTYNGGGATAVTSAKLRNGGETGPDANMTATKGVAESGDTYAYANIDGTGYKWTRLKTIDDCTIADETDPEHPIYYAKPQGYVAITSDEEDENHLFHSVTGSRLFIQQYMEDVCQWWEVTQVGESSVYHCATNDTYYEWIADDPSHPEYGGSWKEVKRTVTFYFTDPKDEAANKKKVLTVNYGAKPDVSIVSNPSKAEDAAATYQFSGWKYSENGTIHAYTATDYEQVYENGTFYLPVFTSITKKYTITLNDAKNGTNVPVEVFYGSVPEYTATKAATAEYTYVFDHWEPELVAVTGPATYTAYWTSIKNRYTITWMDGETILEEDKNQLYGTATAYNGELPAKEMDDDFVYAFSGWKSSLDGNTYANGSTPTIGGHTTYTAQYATTPRYAVTFANYDGTQLQKESVTAGEHPVYNGLTPGRVRDYDGYYKFTGWKNLSGTFFAKDATLPVVHAKETYTAQYDYVTTLFLITLKNVKGQGTAAGDNIWSGKFGVGSTPFYDPNGDDIADAPTKTGDAQYSYEFDGWSLTQDGAKLDPVPEVSGTATYWALFEQTTNKYTITFANVDGNGTSREIEVEYGQTPVCPVTPVKEDNYYTYDFLGWDNTIVAVTGDATYTAQFGEGVARTFTITFEPENGGAAQVLQVAYGQMPAPTTPSKIADAQYSYTFDSWYPAVTAVTEEATYYAQYKQTLNGYTIRFVNYDGTELQSSSVQYGVTPSYAGTPSKPADIVNKKAYNFTGWKNTSDVIYAKNATLPAVTKAETYTAQYSEVNMVASVTTAGSATSYYDSWSSALSAANSSTGSTLKLYSNVTASNNSAVNGNFTLDLNGYKLSCTTSTTSNTRLLYVTGSLTVDDSRGGGKIYYEGSGNAHYYAIYFYNSSGHLTINNGIIECKKTGGTSSRHAYAVYDYYGPTTVNGGELIATSNKNAYALYDYGETVVITGGKFKATASGTAYILSSGSATTISGGYYSMNPNGSYTIASGCAKLDVRDDDPNGVSKAEYPYKVAPAHTITFNNWNGTQLKTGISEDGLLPIAPADPTKTTDPGYVYSFTGWDPALQSVSADRTYTAQFAFVGIEADDSTEPVEITEPTTTPATTVRVSGRLNITSGTLNTTDLILESTTNASGEIDGAENLNVTGGAYFDVKFNGTAGTARRTWYAIAVPWEVNAEDGIWWKEGNRKLVIGSDFDLVWYDGAKRAAEGHSFECWRYVEKETDKIMHPGRAYMMYFASAFQTVRFEKTSTAPIIYAGTVSVSANPSGTGEEVDGGWNGIANPSVWHANMDAGVTYGQVLNNGNMDDYLVNHPEGNPFYKPIMMSGYEFVVGKPVYVQADDSRSVVISQISAPTLAPRRAAKANMPEGIEAVYEVHMGTENYTDIDNLFVQATEDDKEDKYVIGQDLARGGVATKSPQFWVNRYNAQLCVNTQTLVDEVAEYPLSIYVPEEGTYVLHTNNTNETYSLYLTQDGNAIWNLSHSPYTFGLKQGTHTTYGLRISAKSEEIVTSIDEAVVDAQGATAKKVLIDDIIYIIRGENVYTTTGKKVQ